MHLRGSGVVLGALSLIGPMMGIWFFDRGEFFIQISNPPPAGWYLFNVPVFSNFLVFAVSAPSSARP